MTTFSMCVLTLNTSVLQWESVKSFVYVFLFIEGISPPIQ